MRVANTRFKYHLRDARRERGWSQAETAKALSEIAVMEGYPPVKVDANTVSRWECDRQQPQAHHLTLLARLFTELTEYLELGEEAYPTSVPAASLRPVAPDARDPDHNLWEQLSREIRRGVVTDQLVKIDEEIAQVIEAQVKAFYDIELTTPAPLIDPHLATFVNQLVGLLKGISDTYFESQLMLDLGEMLALSGWLSWDMGNYHVASQYYRSAAQIAHRLGDGELLACCNGYMSYIVSQQNDARPPLDLLSAALSEIDYALASATCAWLEARQAEELARLGDVSAVALLERSRERLLSIDLSADRRWAAFLTPTRIDNFAVNVYLELGRVGEAEMLAMPAVASVEYPKICPVVLADAATVQIQLGNLQEGCELGAAALAEAAKGQSKWVIARLQRLCRHLQLRAVNSPDASDLANKIVALSKFSNLEQNRVVD